MIKMCSEWSDAEFLLSHGNPEVVLIMLIDVKILNQTTPLIQVRVSPQMTCRRGWKLRLAAVCFLCGIWKPVVLICYYFGSGIVYHVLWWLGNGFHCKKLSLLFSLILY